MKNTFILFLIAVLSHVSASSLPPTANFAQFRSNLYIVSPDKSLVLMDGTLTQYDDGYSNAVDGMDGRKLFNSSENIGMLRGNTVLIVERRQTIQNSDSIFFKMWNMRVITYQLDFITSNLDKPGRIGLLVDNFLHTETPLDLNGTSHINFSVTTDPASKASDRFTVIFSTLPLTFTSVKAFEKNNEVNLEWKTIHQYNITQFNVESSVDGKLFQKAIAIKANDLAANSYQWVDAHPVEGSNYFRISGIETSGKVDYSDTVKVEIAKRKQNMYVFPNPVNGNSLNLQMINQEAGIYEIRLVNLFGKNFMSKTINYPGGSSTQSIRPAQNISKGIYQLEIKMPDGERRIISVVF